MEKLSKINLSRNRLAPISTLQCKIINTFFGKLTFILFSFFILKDLGIYTCIICKGKSEELKHMCHGI